MERSLRLPVKKAIKFFEVQSISLLCDFLLLIGAAMDLPENRWYIVQLSEEGETSSYAQLIAELKRFVGLCHVFFPYSNHPKDFYKWKDNPALYEYPLCSYLFLKIQDPLQTLKLRSSSLFTGPLLEGGVVASVSEMELANLNAKVRHESEIVPRLGHFVQFKVGQYKGTHALVIGKTSTVAQLEVYLKTTKVLDEVDLTCLLPENDMKNNLVVDAMNLAIRSAASLDFLSSSSGLKTGMIYGFLRAIFHLKKSMHIDNCYVVWDRTPVEKYKTYAGYKQNRPKSINRDALVEQFKMLNHILSNLGIFQCWAEEQEADDVIASLVAKELISDLNFIYSNDDDFLQLVRDGKVIVIKPKSKKGTQVAFDESEVKKKYGVAPSILPFYRAIKGDTSDNLKCVPYINSERLAEFCQLFMAQSQNRTVEEFLSLLQSPATNCLTQKEKERIAKAKGTVCSNFKVSRLNPDLNVNVEWGSFNPDQLRESFEELEFKSFLSILPDLEVSFKSSPGFYKFS